MRRHITILLGVLMLGGVLTAQGAKEPKMKRLYMFGFAASFTDSVAYQTEIQRIDSAWIDEHKFLVDRSLYSLQLQYHLEGVEKKRNTTCTVFFNTNLRRLERKWRRVHRRYEKVEGMHLTTLPREKFFFAAEEYRPIIIEEDTTLVQPTPAVPTQSTQNK